MFKYCFSGYFFHTETYYVLTVLYVVFHFQYTHSPYHFSYRNFSYPNFPAVHEIRNVDANDKFVAAMKASFKDVKLVPRSKQAAGYRHEQVQILVAKRLRR